MSRELQLIETFVVPNKRERYEGFLRSPKNRKKLKLRKRGASGECYLVSVDRKLDGSTRPLADAVRDASEGTLVCCVPGKLAYYEGEAPKNRFILHRRRP